MRCRVYLLSLLSCPALFLAGASRAEEPLSPSSEQQKRATALVRQLAERSYRVRERAVRELLTMGLAARKAVEDGTKDKDPEVRKRCLDLLPDILQAEFRAKLEAFRADKDGKKQHDLPGWKLYREIVGNDREARAFFADLCWQNAAIMELLDKEPAQAGAAVANRCEQLQALLRTPQSGRLPSLRPVDLAPLFLVLSQPRTGTTSTVTYQLTNLFYQPGIRELLTAKGSTPFKKLVLAWMSRQPEDHTLGHILSTASNLNMPEVVEVAEKVVRSKTTGAQGHAHGMVILGKSGGKKHIELFESFLEDKGNVSSFGIGNNLRGSTEVRDVALAMLVHVTGQKHTDYDFTFSRETGYSLLFNAPFLGFTTPEERAAAFAKWQQWKARQPKPEKPKK
ncbi:MAG: hypothetical protein HYS12_26895 [Planctomycetes bacterium]|nr:hypothetical protein [Planctomycetota bacterium]